MIEIENINPFLKCLNKTLAAARLPGISGISGSVSDIPLIYVVSLPRSGGTLMGQLLCAQLDVGYISNLAARFWLRPSVGIALSSAVLGDDYRNRISFRSKSGRTPAVEDPNEFGYFWTHWLNLNKKKNHKLTGQQREKLDCEGLK